MDITLEEVKTYCRIDGDLEDDLLQSLLQAAKDYLTGAGIDEPKDDVPLYGLCVKALVLDYYDRRGLTQRPDPYEVPGVRNAINQLKLRAEAARAAVPSSAPAGAPSPQGEGSGGESP